MLGLSGLVPRTRYKEERNSGDDVVQRYEHLHAQYDHSAATLPTQTADDGTALPGPRMSPRSIGHTRERSQAERSDDKRVYCHIGGSGVQSTPQLSRNGYEHRLGLRSDLQRKLESFGLSNQQHLADFLTWGRNMGLGTNAQGTIAREQDKRGKLRSVRPQGFDTQD